MNAMDIQMVESKLSDVTVTAIPMLNRSNSIQSQQPYQQQQQQLQHLQQQHLQQQQQQIQQSSSSSSSSVITTQTSANITTPMTSANNIPSSVTSNSGLSKYAQLLAVIEEMNRDIRPTYTGSRSSAERLKRGIVHARILVRECLLETERSARQ